MKNLFILLAQIHINGLPQVNAGPSTIDAIFSVGSIVAGAMSVLFLLIGAVRYAISGGDPGQAKQARDTILYSIIGLVVSVSAFFVVQFVLGSVNNP